MSALPKTISLDQIAEVFCNTFEDKDTITCYIGSNAATPTASLEALTAAVASRCLPMPFLRMIHILVQGAVPYVAKELQDRFTTYSIFSGGDVH